MIRKMTLLAVLVLFLPCIAFATSVTYSTTGSVAGTTNVAFTSVGSTSVPFTPSVGPLGTLSFSCGRGVCPVVGATLSITISQTVPGVGAGSLAATLTGTVSSVGPFGFVTIVWGPSATIVAGGEATTYTPITTAASTLTPQLAVLITQVHVPEPNAQFLLGLGSLGLMGLATVSRKLISG